MLHHVAAAMALVKAYRTHGHLAATSTPWARAPIGRPPPSIPTRWTHPPRGDGGDPRRPPESPCPAGPSPRCCRTSMHLLRHDGVRDGARQSTHEERVCAPAETIETPPIASSTDAGRERHLLQPRLTQVRVAGDASLHKAVPRQEAVLPFECEAHHCWVPSARPGVERAAESGARDVVIGIAHREALRAGRNTVVRRRPRRCSPSSRAAGKVEAGFSSPAPRAAPADGRTTLGPKAPNAPGTTQGDHRHARPRIRSHPRSWRRWRRARAAKQTAVARARRAPRSYRGGARCTIDGRTRPCRARASWPTTRRPGRARGDRTGGTLHIITNNQVGFTTDMVDARSTRTPSDLAKGFDIPIIHVKPATTRRRCLSAVRLAMMYRDRVPPRRGDRPGGPPPLRATTRATSRRTPSPRCTKRINGVSTPSTRERLRGDADRRRESCPRPR